MEVGTSTKGMLVFLVFAEWLFFYTCIYTYLRIHYILYLVYIVYMGTCMYSQAFLSTLVCVCGGVSFMFFVGEWGFLWGDEEYQPFTTNGFQSKNRSSKTPRTFHL